MHVRRCPQEYVHRAGYRRLPAVELRQYTAPLQSLEAGGEFIGLTGTARALLLAIPESSLLCAMRLSNKVVIALGATMNIRRAVVVLFALLVPAVAAMAEPVIVQTSTGTLAGSGGDVRIFKAFRSQHHLLGGCVDSSRSRRRRGRACATRRSLVPTACKSDCPIRARRG